jgi:DNA recombination protein RmuC
MLFAVALGGGVGWHFASQRSTAATKALAERSAADSARWAHEQASLNAEIARLEATLSAERAAAADREALLAQSNQQMRETFGSLSAEALAKNNEAFVALAESRFMAARTAADSDLGQRQQAIDSMVAPLRETLEKVQSQLSEVEKVRAGSHAALVTEIGVMRQSSEQLRVETAQLVSALKAPQVRGRWGELQLERTIEAAGMTEHVDYVTQATSTTEDGVQRPDLVVKLVGGKNVIVDSKVAFAGYLEAMEAKDEATRNARFKAHARHMRDHVESLSKKAYWERFTPAPEFVVCFVPADAFLDAALREDPSLQEYAFERDVVIATPSTLVALLRTIAYTWRQEALAANAAEVHQLGRELYQRLSTMGGHVDKLGQSLQKAVQSYNQTVTSLETRVFVTARKMTDLKVETKESLTQLNQITEVTRATQAPELVTTKLVALSSSRPAVIQSELPVSDIG